ncbi:uncharacterized protein TEOVI_000338400 [Trypanosoma equiperdum]|uniref:Uncharacterized protein n=1 Tax=Trypanosoma equiperdum TaxID=5694 RepID=A0A1G4IH79_TRYEQ|nr:hypothetical protein, conserved [Trypanosoma equiperdum]
MLHPNTRIGTVFQTRGVGQTKVIPLRCSAAAVGGVSGITCIETIQLPGMIRCRASLQPSLWTAFINMQWAYFWQAFRRERVEQLLGRIRCSWQNAVVVSSNATCLVWHTSRNANTIGRRASTGCWTTPSRPLAAISRPQPLFSRSWRQPRALPLRMDFMHVAKRHLGEEGYCQATATGFFVTPTIATAQVCMTRWYGSRAQLSLVDFESMKRLCREERMQRYGRRVALVVGFLTNALGSSSCECCPQDVLNLLSVSERVEVISTIATTPFVKTQPVVLEEMLLSVFSDECLSQEAAYSLLQVIDKARADGLPVSTMCFSEGIHCVLSKKSANSNASQRRELVAATLACGERVLGFDELASRCDLCGLWYESAAYRTAVSGVLMGLNRLSPGTDGKEFCLMSTTSEDIGFGGLVLLLLQFLRMRKGAAASHIAAIEFLRCRMSPCVANFTKQSVAVELARMESNSAFLADNYPSALHYLWNADQKHKKERELAAAAWLHFDVKCGTPSTAAVLLSCYNNNWNGIAYILQRTRQAGLGVALNALSAMIELTPTGCYYAIVRLCFPHSRGYIEKNSQSKGSCTFLFEARAPGGERGGDVVLNPPKNVLESWQFVENAVRQHRQRLLLQLGGGCAVWSLSAEYAQQIAVALPQLSGTLLSQWIRGVLYHNQWNTIFTLLRVAAGRGVSPEMEVLVEILEKAYRNIGRGGNGVPNEQKGVSVLQSVVENIRTLFPYCAQTVFRAFVERIAVQLDIDTTSSLPWDSALRILSAVNDLGLMHYPRNCMELVATSAPAVAAFSMLQMLDTTRRADNHVRNHFPLNLSPLPLEVAALQSLLRSAQSTGLHVVADAFAVPPSNINTARVTWWSSSELAVGIPVATALYRRQAVGLWYVALQSLHRSFAHSGRDVSNVDAHHAIRLAAFGSTSNATLLQCLVALPKHEGKQELAFSRRRLKRADDATLVTTLGCIVGALTARGAWEVALRILPLGATDLPPLLRCAQEHAIRLSDGNISTGGAEEKRKDRFLKSGGRRGSRKPFRHHAMPTRVKRLVVKMHLEDSFRWWDNNQKC